MGFLFETLTADLIFFFVFFDVLLILYFWNSYQFWKRKNVPFLQPSFPFGNMTDFITQKSTLGANTQKVYFELKKKGVKYGGYYSLFNPIFMPLDPEIVKQVMIKDFTSFQDRGLYHNEKDDPLSAHLFAIGGPKWRKLRVKLTPTFTSGKMKQMFHTLTACGEYLEEHLNEKIQRGEPLDIKDIGARFTTDIISLCAFGLENYSLKEPDNDFRKYGKRIFERTYPEKVTAFFRQMMPKVAKNIFHAAQTQKEVREFFLSTIKQTVDYREKNKVERNDMLNLLIKLKNNQKLDDTNEMTNGKSEDSLTFEELAAQCFVFFIAGYETSSTTMTFTLFELCQHQDIQDKVREEVRRVLKNHDGELTYDAVQEMTYMEQVVNEALRKYPPVPILNRTSTKDWQIPGTNTTIPKGTRIVVSNFGLQMDPEYYPEPEKFDPERFSEERKSSLPAFTHLPFGDGPRNCIGARFGMMQTKVGLATFLKNYRYKLDSKTIIPIVFDQNSFVLSHKYGIWLQAEKV